MTTVLHEEAAEKKHAVDYPPSSSSCSKMLRRKSSAIIARRPVPCRFIFVPPLLLPEDVPAVTLPVPVVPGLFSGFGAVSVAAKAAAEETTTSGGDQPATVLEREWSQVTPFAAIRDDCCTSFGYPNQPRRMSISFLEEVTQTRSIVGSQRAWERLFQGWWAHSNSGERLALFKRRALIGALVTLGGREPTVDSSSGAVGGDVVVAAAELVPISDAEELVALSTLWIVSEEMRSRNGLAKGVSHDLAGMVDANMANEMGHSLGSIHLGSLLASLRSPHENVCTVACGVVWSCLCVGGCWGETHGFPLQGLLERLLSLGDRVLSASNVWRGPALTLW